MTEERNGDEPSGFSHTLSFVLVLNQYVLPSGFRCSVYVMGCTLDVHGVELERALTHTFILRGHALGRTFVRRNKLLTQQRAS